MKFLIAIFIVLLLALQYPLWFGNRNIFGIWELKKSIAVQDAKNAQLKARNAILEAQIRDLKQGTRGIEERARSEMGMVKRGETFYQITSDSLSRSTGED